MNGDKAADLIVSYVRAPAEIYTNDGKGSFSSPPIKIAGSGNATSLHLTDIDGDKDLDLIVGTAGKALVYKNDGKARFSTSPLTLRCSNVEVRAIASADFDGDGDTDLAFGSRERRRPPSPLHLYLNDGKGNFRHASQKTLAEAPEYPHAIRVRDINGDGQPDLIMTGPDVQILLNDSFGKFVKASASLGLDKLQGFAGVGDVNGDGTPDLVVFGKNGGRIFLNPGGGKRFVELTGTYLKSSLVGTAPIVFADFEGDKDLDMLVPGNPTTLFLNSGRGVFTASPLKFAASRFEPLVGDINKDGFQDVVLIVARPPYQGADVYISKSATSYSIKTVSFAITNSLAMADLNADGNLDIVVGTGNGGWMVTDIPPNRIYWGDGRGGFVLTRVGRWHRATESIAIADIDADGDPDILFGQELPEFSAPLPNNDLYLNDGKGGFQLAPALLPKDTFATRSLAIADLDGDGDMDIVLGNEWTPVVQWNTTIDFRTPLLARLGQPFSLVVHGQPGHFALPMLSLDTVSVAVPPFGTLRLATAGLHMFPPQPIPKSRRVELVFTIPRNTTFLGVMLYTQAFVVDATTISNSRLTAARRDQITGH